LAAHKPSSSYGLYGIAECDQLGLEVTVLEYRGECVMTFA